QKEAHRFYHIKHHVESLLGEGGQLHLRPLLQLRAPGFHLRFSTFELSASFKHLSQEPSCAIRVLKGPAGIGISTEFLRVTNGGNKLTQ
ncbi:MAG: hypothetical protein KFF73_14245, partial [Cyclobacteriaceae bacterium]|nr:hypothetical protein [Cyclobacteriaceae bacterium]